MAPKKKRLTKDDKEMRKKYWRLKKQQSRKRLKGKDRVIVRVHQQRLKTKNVRVLASRARKALPTSPNKYADTISHLIENATPRKRSALEDNNLHRKKYRRVATGHLNAIKVAVSTLKPQKSKSANQKRRQLVKAAITRSYSLRENARQLGVKWSYLQRINKVCEDIAVTRSDAMTEDSKDKVRAFYRNADISVELPDMKRVTKAGSCKIMKSSIGKAYKTFVETSDVKISKDKFQKLRPKDVKLQHQQSIRNCVCDTCANVSLMGHTVLQTARRQHGCKGCSELVKTFADYLTMLDVTVCERQKTSVGSFAPKECIDRTCEKCSIDTLTGQLHHLETHGITSICWHKWENVTLPNDKKKLCLVSVKSNVRSFMSMLNDLLLNFAEHVFVAMWQQAMFKCITIKLPSETIVMVLDFGQNYLCLHQDEPQELHWDGHAQVTIHPIVCFYRCGTCNEPVRNELVMLSDDLKHDAFAVTTFEKIAVDALKLHTKFDLVVEFDDGASSQYKSFRSFEDISKSMSRFGVKIVRAYYGSRHGKGPSDGVTAVVKRAVKQAVINGEHIQSAEAMFNYCDKNLTRSGSGDCCHSQCSFFNVKHIDRTGTHTALPVQGSRKMQMVESLGPMDVKMSNLACFCDSCMSEFKGHREGTCENQMYVQPAVRFLLTKRGNVFHKNKLTSKRQSKNLTGRKTTVPVKSQSVDVTTPVEVKSSSSRSARRSSRFKSVDVTPEVDISSSHSARRSSRFKSVDVTPKVDASSSHSARRSSRFKSVDVTPEVDTGSSHSAQRSSRFKSVDVTPKVDASSSHSARRSSRSKSVDVTPKVDASSSHSARRSSRFKSVDVTPKVDTNSSHSAKRSSRSKSVDVTPEVDASSSHNAQRSSRFKLVDLTPEVKISSGESANVHPENKKKLTNWSSLQSRLSRCSNYTDMEVIVSTCKGPPLPDLELKSVMTIHGEIDTSSPTVGELYPIKTCADGNCFPRVLSTLVYGNQFHFGEMRARLIFEAIVNKHKYLDNSYLKQNATVHYKKGNFVNVFCQYSDEYANYAGLVLTPTVAENLYEAEVLQVAKNSSYCGIWQFFQAANVLGTTVVSHYPKVPNVHVSADFNRKMPPIIPSNAAPVHILWTYFKRTSGVPNHFVPLLPLLSLPDSEMPGESLPDVMPEKSFPDSEMPGESLPDSEMPEKSLPDEMPEESLPDSEMPEESLPDSEMPEKSLPDSEMPEESLPDSEMPGESLPDDDARKVFAGQ